MGPAHSCSVEHFRTVSGMPHEEHKGRQVIFPLDGNCPRIPQFRKVLLTGMFGQVAGGTSAENSCPMVGDKESESTSLIPWGL